MHPALPVRRRFQLSSLPWLSAPPVSRAAERMTIVSLAVCVVAGIATIGLLLYEADPNAPRRAMWTAFIAFGLLAVSPYLGLAALALLARRSTAASVAAAAATVLSTSFAIWAMVDSFFIDPDAQSALAIFWVPVYQWVGLVAALIVVAVTGSIDRTLRQRRATKLS